MTNQTLSNLARYFGVMPNSEIVQKRIRENFERLSGAEMFRVYVGINSSYRPVRAQKS
jgi:hypothetical protein